MIVNARKWDHAQLARLREYESAEKAAYDSDLSRVLRRYLVLLNLLCDIGSHGSVRTETMAGAIATGAFESRVPAYSAPALRRVRREVEFLGGRDGAGGRNQQLEDFIARLVDGESRRDAA